MPKKLQDYLFKIKNPRPQIRLSSPKNWLLSGCKHPRTPSFAFYAANNNNNNNNKVKDDAATLADVDRFLFENFKSLYLKDDEESENTKRVSVSEDQNHEAPKLASLFMESPRLVETPRDLCGSTRFVVKTGFSGSLVADSLTNTSEEEEEEAGSMSTISTTTLNDVSSSMNYYYDANAKEGVEYTLPDNTIALLTYSPSPYEDFMRSMQEMVEARVRGNVNIDWDFMEELLFCYLNLNDKKSHKFILRAFVDLITAMRRNSEPAPAKPRSVRTVRTGQGVRNIY